MLYQIKTKAGVNIEYEQHPLAYPCAIESLIDKLNSQRGALFASNFEFPGRYTTWDIGFYNPPLALTCQGQRVCIDALNQRGEVLLLIFEKVLQSSTNLNIEAFSKKQAVIAIIPSDDIFTEEERSKQPSIFSLLRILLDFFYCDDSYLGFYGAFGYDLIYQFESLLQKKQRDSNQRDMVIYFPDEIYVVNHPKETAFVRRYDFQYEGKTTLGLSRDGVYCPYDASQSPNQKSDHGPGDYAKLVEKTKECFAKGDLFEVVLSQTFFEHFKENPGTLFRQLRQVNPSPYTFFINLGEEEYLVGASPEMYVRLQGHEVETCPISGTIKRGSNALEDAKNIQLLLDSEKEESELTMCTDVDRNDKSRICIPGTVQVVGRRQIEMYSRVIHTVDHVKGVLRPGFDAVDAFLTHMWVVTVTGAPKLWAMNFIEQEERSPRRWYAGAVGWFGVNGHLNTGLVLRTIRIEKGIAEVRVGATLLYDSDPAMEEEETKLKASAFIGLLNKETVPNEVENPLEKIALGKKILLVDHQDSFVHTLANYIRQTGAQVATIRFEHAKALLHKESFDLVVLSPGPGRPSDFHLNETIRLCIEKKLPLFGVCLGLQGLVEYFGGQLDVLSTPVHGKASLVYAHEKAKLFKDLKSPFTAARYHSLYANKEAMPSVLNIDAYSEDGVIMAISHKELPIYAVQFHPEAILSLHDQVGMHIIANLMKIVFC